jgi:virulence factor Mce-like protein
VKALVALAAMTLAAVVLWQHVFSAPGGRTYAVEFTNARGLVAGNDVRVLGAPAGRVTAVTLNRDGTARVSFRLSSRSAPPRQDAAAAIEPSDLLGDTYLSLSPGSASQPLSGPIPTSRAVNAPRLDELLDTFQPDVRNGLRVLLVEGGLALDQRGGDLARTTVLLRPTFDAARMVLSELDTQIGSLGHLVDSAQRLAAQLDSARGDIGPALDSLAATLGATASASAPLAHAVAGLPATLARLTASAGTLQATAAAALPLATALRPAAARMGAAVAGMPQLFNTLTTGAPAVTGAIGAARRGLAAGAPGLATLARALPTIRAQAPQLTGLLSELDASVPGIAQGFFVEFPDEAAESGRQPFDPFANPTRNYWRGAAVFSCEAFGVPIAPGCLARALANLTATATATPTSAPHGARPGTASAKRLLSFLLGR